MQNNESNSENSFFNALLQQEIPSLRPIITPVKAGIIVSVVIIICFICGGVFIAVAIDTNQISIRYDDICAEKSVCQLSIPIKKLMMGTIYLRYKLTNFPQSQKRLEESRSVDQLMGFYVDYSDMSTCDQFTSINSSESPENWLLPCGLSALLVFNDTIKVDDNSLNFEEKGIAWKSDVDEVYAPLSSKYTTGIRWLENNSIFKGGQTNEHFIVWMRTSHLSTIIKNYAICNFCRIERGHLNITIHNNYPTSLFNGEKHLIIEKDSVLGTKNMFLGASFFFVGGVHFLFLVVIILERLIDPRKIGDMEAILEILDQKSGVNLPLG